MRDVDGLTYFSGPSPPPLSSPPAPAFAPAIRGPHVYTDGLLPDASQGPPKAPTRCEVCWKQGRSERGGTCETTPCGTGLLGGSGAGGDNSLPLPPYRHFDRVSPSPTGAEPPALLPLHSARPSTLDQPHPPPPRFTFPSDHFPKSASCTQHLLSRSASAGKDLDEGRQDLKSRVSHLKKKRATGLFLLSTLPNGINYLKIFAGLKVLLTMILRFLS